MKTTSQYYRIIKHNRPSVSDSLGMISVPFVIIFILFTSSVVVGATIHTPVEDASNPDTAMFGVEDPTWIDFTTNNLLVVAMLLSGAVLFGLPTLVSTLLNGVLIGLLIAGAATRGIDWVGIALLIAPHGIAEIPALLLAGAIGISLPRKIIAYLREKRAQILRLEELIAYGQLIVLITLLILVAAWIEASLTGPLYDFWNG